MNSEEYVPTITPKNIQKINPRMVSPPNTKSINSTNNVATPVTAVRLKVLFKALFIVVAKGSFRSFLS